MNRKSKADWVVAGGKPGELGHCGRCGRGLEMTMPQDISVCVAAMNAFVKVHSKCVDTGRNEPRPIFPSEWARGRDTGVSSATIYSVITGNPTPYSDRDIPHDPDDFGRCYRLLKLFPDWRAELEKVAAVCPIWIPYVREWNKLTELYEQALASTARDRGREMYDFMKVLEHEAYEQNKD